MITNKMDHEPTGSNLSQLFSMQQSASSSSCSSSDSNRSCSSTTSSLCSSPSPQSPSDHHHRQNQSDDGRCFSSLMMHYQQSEPIFIKNEKAGSMSSSSQVNMLLSSSSSSSTASTSPSKMIICCDPEEDRADMTDMTSPFASSRGLDNGNHRQSANDRTNMSQTTEDYLDYSSVSADDEDYDEMDLGPSQQRRQQQQESNSLNGSETNAMSDLNNNNINCLNDLPMSGSVANNVSSNSSSSSRANRFFPDWVVDILNRWFNENLNFPYPDETMTNLLAKEASISPKQVRKWFANKRVRSNKCYKQTFRKKDGARVSRKETKSISDLDMLSCSPAVGQENYYQTHHSSTSSSGSEDTDNQHNQYGDRLGHSGLKKSISMVGAWPLDNSANSSNSSASKQSLSSSVSSSCSSYIYRNEKKTNCSEESSSSSHHSQQQMSSPNGTTHIQAYLNLFSNLVNMNKSTTTETPHQYHHHHLNNNNNNNRSSSSCSINSACLTCSNNRISNENKSEPALATASSYLATAAICNPYFYLAILSQNPNAAANLAALRQQQQNQPTFAQREDSVFEAQSSTMSKETESELYRKNLESQLKSSSPPSSLKRKTHLSNIFMNDMSQQQMSRENSDDSEKLAQILRTAECPVVESTIDSRPTQQLIDSLLMYSQQQQQSNTPTVVPKRKTKVNFGDISDLIN